MESIVTKSKPLYAEIIHLAKRGMKRIKIAERVGVKPDTVSDIIRTFGGTQYNTLRKTYCRAITKMCKALLKTDCQIAMYLDCSERHIDWYKFDGEIEELKEYRLYGRLNLPISLVNGTLIETQPVCLSICDDDLNTFYIHIDKDLCEVTVHELIPSFTMAFSPQY